MEREHRTPSQRRLDRRIAVAEADFARELRVEYEATKREGESYSAWTQRQLSERWIAAMDYHAFAVFEAYVNGRNPVDQSDRWPSIIV